MPVKGGTRILVVDDSPDLRSYLKLLLEGAGYDVVTAGNGNRAIEFQRETPCGVLVTDIFMPEGDGLETIARFRREFPTVRIIAISGGGRQMTGEKYLGLASIVGADATLPKPFESADLLQTLDRLLSAKSGKKEQ